MLPTYSLPLHLPPPGPPPTLTVTAKGRAYPSKTLLSKLGLRAKQPIDLLPPSAECPGWQLDLRPTARLRVSWYADTRPRITGLRLPTNLFTLTAKLTLALGAATPQRPGLYQLNLVPTAQSESY